MSQFISLKSLKTWTSSRQPSLIDLLDKSHLLIYWFVFLKELCVFLWRLFFDGGVQFPFYKTQYNALHTLVTLMLLMPWLGDAGIPVLVSVNLGWELPSLSSGWSSCGSLGALSRSFAKGFSKAFIVNIFPAILLVSPKAKAHLS